VRNIGPAVCRCANPKGNYNYKQEEEGGKVSTLVFHGGTAKNDPNNTMKFPTRSIRSWTHGNIQTSSERPVAGFQCSVLSLPKNPQITQITQIFTRLKFAVICVIRGFFR
jgi:hypothetical protein